MLYAMVISAGIGLGRIKVFGISLGVTFVLFAGIVAGHFGFTGTPSVLTYIQDFGLILFVYCIGLQVGPGFFESLREGGVKMNLLASGIIALNGAAARLASVGDKVIIMGYELTDEPIKAKVVLVDMDNKVAKELTY